jgi:hypothetical protein
MMLGFGVILSQAPSIAVTPVRVLTQAAPPLSESGPAQTRARNAAAGGSNVSWHDG